MNIMKQKHKISTCKFATIFISVYKKNCYVYLGKLGSNSGSNNLGWSVATTV